MFVKTTIQNDSRMMCSDITRDLVESSSPHSIYDVCPDPDMILLNVSQRKHKSLQLFLDLDNDFECGGLDIVINQTKKTIYLPQIDGFSGKTH